MPGADRVLFAVMLENALLEKKSRRLKTSSFELESLCGGETLNLGVRKVALET